MSLLQSIGLMVMYALATMEAGWPMMLRQADRWRSAVEAPSIAISADGRFAAFVSHAPLLASDTNHAPDIYVFDTHTGTLTLETIAVEGTAANGGSAYPALSADGRVLAFQSVAGNLTGPGRRTLDAQIYVRDRVRRETRLVSVGVEGAPASGGSFKPSLSAAGDMVAFESGATNLVDGPDANGEGADVYVANLRSGTIERVSVNGAGEQSALGTSFTPSISADGRRVGFTSSADLECPSLSPHADRPRRLDEGGTPCPPWRQDTNGLADVYLRDLEAGWTRRVSRGLDGSETFGSSHHPSLSGEGRFVAFVSSASTLVEDDGNGTDDVFVYDLETEAITLVSQQAGSATSANGRSLHPRISPDGRLVGFQSQASDLVCARRCGASGGDRRGAWDVFLFDRDTSRTTRVSAGPSGKRWGESSSGIALDARGRLVAFQSVTRVEAPDEEIEYDLFLRRMRAPDSSD